MIAVAERQGSVRLAVALLWVTLLYNVFEGVIAVTAGWRAGSVALVAFGLDSGIEVTAAAALLWRLREGLGGDASSDRDRRAHQIVGATFVVLVAFIVSQVLYKLIAGEEPEASSVGLWLALASLVFSPVLGLAKRRNAQRLHSHALVAEASETLVCSYLSVTLLAGLALNAAFGWWWADIAAALAMLPWIVKEGLEGLRGETCEDGC